MIRGSFGLSALIFVGALTMAVTSQPSAAADNSAPRVRNVVLVHGAWADGSSWAKVIPLLEKAGLNAVAVQNPLTSLADDVAATKRAIARLDGPVILVGHSYGGAVISEGGNDRMIPPDLERKFAKAMNAKTITLHSSHVPMLSHPTEVAKLIIEAVKTAPSQ